MSLKALFNVRTGEIDWADVDALRARAEKQFPFEWVWVHESFFYRLSEKLNPGGKAFWATIRQEIGERVHPDYYYCELYAEPILKNLAGRADQAEVEEWRSALASQFDIGVQRFIEYCHAIHDTRQTNSGTYEYQLVDNLRAVLDPDVVEALCQSDAKIMEVCDRTKRPKKRREDSLGAFLKAARDGDVERMRELVASGWEADVVRGTPRSSDDEQTPLQQAALHGRMAAIEFLLQSGADPNLPFNGGFLSPVIAALGRGHFDIAELLIQHGANISSAAQELAGDGNVAGLKWLIDSGVDVRGVWLGGDADTDTLRLLLDHGADPNGMLLSAALHGKVDNVRLLLDAGARLEEQNVEGQTALHWAAESGHGRVVQLLCERGADTSARDKAGKTPLQLATDKGHSDVVALLQKSGASPTYAL